MVTTQWDDHLAFDVKLEEIKDAWDRDDDPNIKLGLNRIQNNSRGGLGMGVIPGLQKNQSIRKKNHAIQRIAISVNNPFGSSTPTPMGINTPTHGNESNKGEGTTLVQVKKRDFGEYYHPSKLSHRSNNSQSK